MKIEPFKMERMQSIWENAVDYNLSESGVHPLTFEELVPPEERKEIFHTSLGYLQTNGTSELREKICLLYPGRSFRDGRLSPHRVWSRKRLSAKSPGAHLGFS